jgi:D-glycero-alpha-D-manno-heptose-7-phosphate kinase
MIVTRTPFRVTLGGGGTDLPSFYREHGGFVFAMGIDKYMYLMLNPPTIDDRIRLHYSRSEVVDDIDELQHELAREALRLHGIRNGIEISSMADLPDGTGLGSSSAYLVGLLLALHEHRGRVVPLQALAEEACHIELDVLDKPIGKQDQYMAAFGGLTVMDIARDGSVAVHRMHDGGSALDEFVANTHLYYTGLRRSAVDVLREQDSALRQAASAFATVEPASGALHNGGGAAAATDRPAPADGRPVAQALLRIKDLGYRILEAVSRGDFHRWGELLHEHWCNKKRLSSKISVDRVDAIYEHVRREHDVVGGKIAGAGGGGFLMLYCAGNHDKLEQFMEQQGMPRLHYSIEAGGAQVAANLRGLVPSPRARADRVEPAIRS